MTKFSVLRSSDINKKVFNYLKIRLSNLYIEVLDIAKGNILTLMNLEQLEGWCFDTTESAIVFFNDEDDIKRGILNISEKYPKYYHSWICFSYEKEEYFFDPCLNLVCKKKDYMAIFNIQIKGQVSAKKVKKELMKQVIPFQKGKINIHGIENVNAPFYRNNSDYKIEIEQGKIKKMQVYYHY